MNREELAEMITAVYDRELQIDDVVMILECEVHARQAAQRQVADLQERLNRADAERCAAVLTEREACAAVADAIEEDKWALYKGRPPYTGREPGRAEMYTQGESDGAGLCADAIRARGKT